MIGSRLKQFRIVEKLGQGGMGEVYRAEDESLERDVAIKVLPATRFADAEARQRFRKEALALSKLNHPHIATIHAFDSSNDVDYLVMELVDGPTLQDLISQAPLLEEEVLRIGESVADAVGEAHQRGIVHRDLKPANIKLSVKGEVKVLDFGLASLLAPVGGDPETQTTMTVVSPEVAGTLAYMAPDQLRGRMPDATTDVWSLGVTLHEAITGVRPFRGGTAHEVSAAILNDSPAPLPATVSGHLRGVIERCLRKDPRQRFQNAGEVRVALQTLQSSPAVTSVPTPRRRIGWRALAAGTAITAAVIFLGVRGRQVGSGSAPVLVASVVAAPSSVTAGEEDSFLSDAIPRTISNHLSLVNGLVTKVPPSEQAYMAMGNDPSRLADAYRVGAVVLSSITARAERMVLNVQLVESGTQRLLWGGDFEGSRDDYLDLVSEASRSIRTALRPDAENIPEPELSTSSEAELILQRGFHHLDLYFSQGSKDDLGVAAKLFREAMAEDPTNAGAMAAFAQIQMLEIGHGADPAGAIERAEMWARRAVQLDERSSQAWYVLSLVESSRPGGDADESLRYALKAAAFGPLNPYAHISLGVTLAATSCELGAAAYMESPRVNPLDLNSSAAAAGLIHSLGRSDEALSMLERVLTIEPRLPYPLLQKALVLGALGESESAAEVMQRLEGITAAPFPPQVLDWTRTFLSLSGSLEGGGDAPAVTEVVKMARGEGTLFPFWERATISAAPLLARKGHAEEALATLEARLERGIIDPYDLLVWNPDIDPLRPSARFAPLLEASRLRFEAMVSILEEARGRGELPRYLERVLGSLMEQLPKAA